MNIITRLRSRRILLLAYSLFLVSMLLPTFAIDLGSNSNPVQPGYNLFFGGPVAAIGIILEPGGEQSKLYLGIYYLVTWFANFALVLPILTMVPQHILRVLAGTFTLLAWSVLFCSLLISDNLIREIGIGYYLWSVSITLILLFLTANKIAPARDEVPV